jgi:hypothetical protein
MPKSSLSTANLKKGGRRELRPTKVELEFESADQTGKPRQQGSRQSLRPRSSYGSLSLPCAEEKGLFSTVLKCESMRGSPHPFSQRTGAVRVKEIPKVLCRRLWTQRQHRATVSTDKLLSRFVKTESRAARTASLNFVEILHKAKDAWISSPRPAKHTFILKTKSDILGKATSTTAIECKELKLDLFKRTVPKSKVPLPRHWTPRPWSSSSEEGCKEDMGLIYHE